MYIGFNLDDIFYSGTATLIENEDQVQYIIDLNESVHDNAQFTLSKLPDGKWTSDHDINPDLVNAAGTEIDKHVEGYTGEPLVPNSYYSTERTDGKKPVFKDGEVINEPGDVDEQSTETR